MKILVIGQAPPANKQVIPYDTTQIYTWLKESCDISMWEAQRMFEFEAIYNEFPGFDANGGHLKPSKEQMDKHWTETLETKVQLADKVWVLGNVARDYIATKPKTWGCTTEWLYTMHPSKRNLYTFNQNKERILKSIKDFING